MATVTTVTWTGIQDIDGLLQGYQWGDTSLTFSFPSDGSFYGSHYATTNTENTTGFAQLNAAQQAAALDVFARYQAVSGLTFTQIGETSTQHATLREAQSGLSRTADTFSPDPYFTNAEDGDSWYSSYRTWYQNPVKGSYGYYTFMHEIGIALGLRDDVSGTDLTYAHDSMEYTVESYNSYLGSFSSGAANGVVNDTWSYAQTPMMMDIAAIQHMYGANYSTNSGDTVYSWDPNTGEEFINGIGQGAPGGNKIFMTVWDGNGNDTYDFSNYTTNLSVDLRPGAWTTVSTAQLADLGAQLSPGTHMAAGNIANALLYQGNTQSLIENAIGGSGNDTIIGNQANNHLVGGAGNDVLEGLGGNDIIDGGAGNDTAAFTGNSTDYLFSRGGDGSLIVADQRAGSPDGTDTLISIENLQFNNGTFTPSQLGIAAPVATAVSTSIAHGGAVAAASLFTSSAPYAQQYQFRDLAASSHGGSFVFSGVAQPNDNTPITIASGDLANLSYQAGTAPDALSVRIYDGTQWGSWTPLSVTVTDNAPTVAVSDQVATKGQSFAASSLFTASDVDTNDSIVGYQFWDGTADPSSGVFVVNGVRQDAGTAINVSADQLSNTYFQSGSGMDRLWVRATDGMEWSAWKQFNVTAPIDHAATIAVQNIGAAMNYTLAASQLFTASDADGDPQTEYQFWDSTPSAGSGYFTINGVAQAAGQAIDVAGASLGGVSFVTGSVSGTDQLWVRSFDGVLWSDWKSFTVTAPVTLTPQVVVANTAIAKGGSISASDLFSASVPYSNEQVTAYQVWDGTATPTSGYFVVDGVAQTAGHAIDVSLADLSQTYFQANGASSDQLWVRAATGDSWSDWVPFTVSAPDAAPVATAADIIATKGEVFQAADLFHATDSDAGDTISEYQFWDSTSADDSGYFTVNGVKQAAGQNITIDASQLANTQFHTDSGSDQLWVRAYDGQVWGNWVGFNVNAPINHAPVAAATDHVIAKGATVDASSLFTVTDQDGDTITHYQFWDSTADESSGHFAVNGVAQNAGAAIDVAASDLSHVSFVAGIGSVDDLWVRAFDGLSWGAWQEFHVSAPNHAPVVSVTDLTATKGEAFAASDLFTASDADAGDSITQYQFWDSTSDTNSGHFVVDGVQQAAGQNINVDASQLANTSFQTGSGSDLLWVRAFDGQDWGAWKSFTVTAPADHAPTVTANDITLSAGQSVQAASLFSVTDVDAGDTAVSYQFWDSTAGANTGHFAISGVEQAAGQAITVLAGELDQASFVAGVNATDQLWVRASDGALWSDWVQFHATSAAAHG